LDLLCQSFRSCDVFILCGLVTSTEEHDEECSTLNKVDAITCALRDTKFADAFADWLYIAGIAEGEASNSCCDLGFCSVVAESF